MEGRYIFWDLDDTLGDFRRIAYAMQGNLLSALLKDAVTTYNIRNLLTEFATRNEQYITTGGVETYAREALRIAKLDSYFKEIYARDTVIPSAYGKHYLPVVSDIGIPLYELSDKVIIIGDAPGDAPADIEGLVFVQWHHPVKTDAFVVKTALEGLLEAGEGSFLEGFKTLHAIAPTDGREEFYERRPYILTPDLSLLLSFRETELGDPTVPYVEIVTSRSIRREPDKLQV